jgi:hypothetical protein
MATTSLTIKERVAALEAEVEQLKRPDYDAPTGTNVSA